MGLVPRVETVEVDLGEIGGCGRRGVGVCGRAIVEELLDAVDELDDLFRAIRYSRHHVVLARLRVLLFAGPLHVGAHLADRLVDGVDGVVLHLQPTQTTLRFEGRDLVDELLVDLHKSLLLEPQPVLGLGASVDRACLRALDAVAPAQLVDRDRRRGGEKLGLEGRVVVALCRHGSQISRSGRLPDRPDPVKPEVPRRGLVARSLYGLARLLV